MNISFDPSSPKMAPVKMLAVPPSAALADLQVSSVGDALRANFTTSLLQRLEEAKTQRLPEVSDQAIARARELSASASYPSPAVMRAVVQQILG